MHLMQISGTVKYMHIKIGIYRQIVGIPMGTNCAPLVADSFYSAMKEIS